MLYQISMFWDARHTEAYAIAESAETSHWVTVSAKDAAKTTIFVADANKAAELAALINRFTGAEQPVQPMAVCTTDEERPAPTVQTKKFYMGAP